MKAIYTMTQEQPTIECNELRKYDYNTRYEALKEGFKYVHLFETKLNENEEKEYSYYSTMQMFV